MIPSGTVRKYDTYKDSGIAWIGEIPEGWDWITLKRVFSNRDGGAWGEEAKNNENDRICIRIADFDYPRMTIKHDINYTVRNYAQDVIKKLTLQKNDILVEKSGGGEQTPVGRTIIFNENFEALYANFMDRLRVRRGNVPKFIEYLLVSFYQNGITYQYIKQTTGIQNLDVEELLAKEYAALPSEREQRAIADYLDKKCGAIDKTIETEEKVIEKLKEYKQSLITETVTKGLDKSAPMKDSGIPWIGQIPQHWEVGKVVYFFGVTLGKMLQPTQKEVNETLKNYLCAANLGGNQLKIGTLKQMWFSQREKEEYTIKKNDLLVVEGGDIASCDIVPHDLPGVYFQNSILRVRPKGNMSVKILRYLLHVAKWTGHIDLICNKATIAHFTKEKLSNLACLKIPASEQQAIVKYLDDKCAKIDKSIADKEQVIEKLTEYKKSLIYECVTGKRMVA